MPNADEFLSSLGQILAGMAMGLGAFALTKIKDYMNKKMRFMSTTALNRNVRIKDLLQEIRVHFDADRVKLYQFHNGDYYVTGESVQKMSLSHYVVKRGVEGPEAKHQGIPVSYVSAILAEMVAADGVLVKPVADMDPDCFLQSLMIQGGVQTTVMGGVNGQHGHLIGVIIVGWLDDVSITTKKINMIDEFLAACSAELRFGK